MKTEDVIGLVLVVERGTEVITPVGVIGAEVETRIVVQLEVAVVAEIETGIRLIDVSGAKAEKEIEAVLSGTVTVAEARKEKRRESRVDARLDPTPPPNQIVT